ncbi:MAG: phosphate signaling complex protein PhoU [Roseiflexaceae bacterium]
MHPREHFMQQLDALHAELRSLGQLVVAAITWSLDALNRHDVVLAQRIVADDRDIDRAQYTLQDHAIVVIATQQPVAGDLRQLIAAIETASELERIADYAKSIARIVIRDAGRSSLDPPAGMAQMAERALAMLNEALEAFIRQDGDAARRLGAADDQVDALQKQVRAELIERLEREPANAARLADLLAVTQTLERIADRATNIAERVVFMVSGAQIELNP